MSGQLYALTALPTGLYLLYLFCFVRTVHFGMKLYNDQPNAQVFNLFYLSIFFCLTCFGRSFSPSSEAGVQRRQWFKSAEYGVRARALTPYPGVLNHCRICTPASEDGLKERPKHVRQKKIDK
jgi:hypothetical protein